MANEVPPPTYVPRTPQHLRELSSADFETASIRSAAPSYTSAAAPTYTATPSPGPSSPFNASSTASSRRSSNPTLTSYVISSSTWSTTRANPTARHYHSVASRRATIASAQQQQKILAAASSMNPMHTLIKTIEEEEREKYDNAGRVRPHEDEELVGREAAEAARRERLGWGNDVLIQEDKRWDWLLAQMKDWDAREKSWSKFRVEAEQGKKGRLARRLGLK